MIQRVRFVAFAALLGMAACAESAPPAAPGARFGGNMGNQQFGAGATGSAPVSQGMPVVTGTSAGVPEISRTTPGSGDLGGTMGQSMPRPGRR